MAKGALIAAMDFSNTAADEFNDWYDTEHIPERLARTLGGSWAPQSRTGRLKKAPPFPAGLLFEISPAPKVFQPGPSFALGVFRQRYDLSNNPIPGVLMSGGRKPVQAGVRVKLPPGITWAAAVGRLPSAIWLRGAGGRVN
jgi:hypothetical protein